MGPGGRRSHGGQRRPRRQGRRPLAPGPPPDGRAELPRAAAAAPGAAPPDRIREATGLPADDPDLPVLGPPRAVRRAGRGRRGGPRGARHGARAARVRAGLGRAASPATPTRAMPVATSRCRRSTRTSSSTGSRRRTSPCARCRRCRSTSATRLPNKFLEAMAGGTPIVLGPDLPTMEEMLRREDLGRVAASMDPADIAAAIRSILDLPADERAAWRERIATTARERYSVAHRRGRLPRAGRVARSARPPIRAGPGSTRARSGRPPGPSRSRRASSIRCDRRSRCASRSSRLGRPIA